VHFVHEYDARGNHRLILDGTAGDWVAYRGFATFRTQDGVAYFVTTQFYDGTFEADLPYLVTEASSKLAEVKEVAGDRPAG
jgi:hypothetical protein